MSNTKVQGVMDLLSNRLWILALWYRQSFLSRSGTAIPLLVRKTKSQGDPLCNSLWIITPGYFLEMLSRLSQFVDQGPRGFPGNTILF